MLAGGSGGGHGAKMLIAKMVEKFATCVADTGGKFATGVVDTGGAP